MTELDDLEEIAMQCKTSDSRYRRTPALVKAGQRHFHRISTRAANSVWNRARSSSTKRKVPITLAGNTGRVG